MDEQEQRCNFPAFILICLSKLNAINMKSLLLVWSNWSYPVFFFFLFNFICARQYLRFPSLKLSAGRDAGADRDQVRRFRQAPTGPAVDDRDTGTESDSQFDLRPKSWFIFGRLYICNLSLDLFIIFIFFPSFVLAH